MQPQSHRHLQRLFLVYKSSRGRLRWLDNRSTPFPQCSRNRQMVGNRSTSQLQQRTEIYHMHQFTQHQQSQCHRMFLHHQCRRYLLHLYEPSYKIYHLFGGPWHHPLRQLPFHNRLCHLHRVQRSRRSLQLHQRPHPKSLKLLKSLSNLLPSKHQFTLCSHLSQHLQHMLQHQFLRPHQQVSRSLHSLPFHQRLPHSQLHLKVPHHLNVL